jgi:hypothetical protein
VKSDDDGNPALPHREHPREAVVGMNEVERCFPKCTMKLGHGFEVRSLSPTAVEGEDLDARAERTKPVHEFADE